MTATIEKKITRKGFCGDQTLHDYLVLDNGQMILRDVFPLDAREIGMQVEVDYVSTGNGMQWWPVGKVAERGLTA